MTPATHWISQAAPSHAPWRSTEAPAPPLSTRALLSITAIFWFYVTLSNVLYAHNMQINVSQISNAMVFAPWSARVVQHLLLFPLLAGCFWISVRARWSALRGIPAQIVLAVVFAATPFFVMDAANWILWEIHLHPKNYTQAMLEQRDGSFYALWTASFVNFMLTYVFGIVLITGFAFYQRFRDAQLHVKSLEQSWSTARLAALRMQLSPHTLFNLLHTIRGQINQEPQIARSMVVQLADLLRKLLSAGQRDFSLVAEEIRFVHLYLELQKQRFADRLTIVLPDPDIQLAVWVPSLILQPLVENAIVHGLAGHEGPIVVRLVVLVSEETTTLRVENTTGPDAKRRAEGIGLSNVRERLAVQFGPRASLKSENTVADTWVAEVMMPALRDFAAQSASE